MTEVVCPEFSMRPIRGAMVIGFLLDVTSDHLLKLATFRFLHHTVTSIISRETIQYTGNDKKKSKCFGSEV
jgi:hypothetical protein